MEMLFRGVISDDWRPGCLHRRGHTHENLKMTTNGL